MPFENLGDKLQSAFKDLRGKGRLSESDIDSALREAVSYTHLDTAEAETDEAEDETQQAVSEI